MIEEIVYEFKKESALRLLNVMIKVEKRFLANTLFLGGLLGFVIVFISILIFMSTPNSLWLLLLLPISFGLIYYGHILRIQYWAEALKNRGIESCTAKLAIKKFKKLELEKIIDRYGYFTSESVLLLQSQVDKEVQRINKKFEFQSILPLSVFVTLFLFTISFLTKELKSTHMEIISFLGLLISVFAIYFSIQKIGNSIFDWAYNSRYRELTDISFLLGNIAIDKIRVVPN